MLKRSIATYELAEEKGNRFGTYTLDEVKGHWKEEAETKRIFSLKRMHKRIDNETYKYITAVGFGDYIRFYTKSEYGTGMYFACYDCTEDILYVFTNRVCSLAHHNELYGLTKDDVIKGLTQ